MKINLEIKKIVIKFVNLNKMNINQKLKMAIIVLCAVLVLPLVLVNCERVNDISQSDKQNFNAKFEQTGDPYDYVFVNPKWELVNAKYTDGYGSNGELYVNVNNIKEKLFVVNNTIKASDGNGNGSGGSNGYKGHYSEQWVMSPQTGEKEKQTKCNYDESPKDCNVKPIFDNSGTVVVGVQINVKPSLR